MNFNIYISDSLAEQLSQIARTSGVAKNSIIRQALQEWIEHHYKKDWPSSIKDYQGVADFESFESFRYELKAPKEDPLS